MLFRRIETNTSQENEKYLEIGGLDTPLEKHTPTGSVRCSGLLDHRNTILTYYFSPAK